MDRRLHDTQIEVYKDKHRFRIVCAGRRWGKSILSRTEILKWAIQKQGLYWIVSPTYRQGKDIHWRALQHEVPVSWVAKKNEVDLEIILKNGSIIQLKGGEDPDRLKGVKLRGLVVDEIASMRNWDWLWQESLRATLVDFKAPAIFISTPKGYNHFYELFNIGQKVDDTYKSWKFTSYENTWLPKGEVENAKKELTEDTFAQEYLADFRKHTGLVYKEFDRTVHVIQPFDIPESWEIYRGIDFGSTNPTACLWIATDGEYNFFLIDEYYQTGQTIEAHAGIINANPFSKRVVQTFGDPSGAQWIKEFEWRGVYITPADKEVNQQWNSWVRLGIEKVAEKLKTIPGHMVNSMPQLSSKSNGISNSMGMQMPSLFIFSSCTNTIREFETYRWKEKVRGQEDLNQPDVPEKANDHCFTGYTMILTKTGWKRIDEIKIGEYVWSPFGWNEVYRAGSTGVKQVKDYGVFKCTPNHKILTSRGLVEVDNMGYSDKILVWTNPRKWSLTELLIGVIQMPRIELIDFIFNALLTKSLIARRDFYIEIYGNTIMVKFLRVIWFIILTGILSITTLVILILSYIASTLNVIIGVYGRATKNISLKFVLLLKLGTLLKKAKLVTHGSLNNLGKIGNLRLRSVRYAVKSFLLPSLLEANTVIKTVKQQPLEDAEVFNLSTKFGCYFANGILVSNSMDALRYFIVSYTKLEQYTSDTNISKKDWGIG